MLTVIPNSFDLSTETLETSRYPAFTKAFMKQQFLLLPVIYGSSFYNVLISLLNRVSTKIFVFEMLSFHKYPFSINLSCLSVKYKYVYLRMVMIIDLNHWVPWEFFHALTSKSVKNPILYDENLKSHDALNFTNFHRAIGQR